MAATPISSAHASKVPSSEGVILSEALSLTVEQINVDDRWAKFSLWGLACA
jgi:hypothetical protein